MLKVVAGDVAREIARREIEKAEKFRQDLRLWAEAQIRSVLDEVLSEARELIVRAEAEATLEREKYLYEALLEVRRAEAEAIEQVLRDAVETVKARFAELARGGALDGLVKSAVARAREVIGESAVATAHPSLVNMLEARAREVGLRLEAVNADESVYGVVLRSPDGSVVVNYTVDEVVATRWEDIKQRVARIVRA